MKSIKLISICLYLVLTSTAMADYAHEWTEDRDGVCFVRREVYQEGLGCRNFEHPCGTTNDVWIAIDCGNWGGCGDCRISSLGGTCYPANTDTYGYLWVAVTPGSGGTFIQVPGGGWSLTPNGSDFEVYPPAMLPSSCSP